jgi:hypothetical protein
MLKIGMHRIPVLIWLDIRPAGYSANPKVGYRISGEVGYGISDRIFCKNLNVFNSKKIKKLDVKEVALLKRKSPFFTL